MPPAGGVVAVVVKGYPRLSETFIAHELRGLEERGLRLRLVSLRRPADRARHPVHDEIEAEVDYLPEYLRQAPLRVLAAWRAGRRRPGWRACRRAWLRDLRRDPTPSRIRRLGQALVMARELPPGVGRVHAHFLHAPASVARYAAMLAGLPWSVSAHAKDIWTTPDWEAREKLAGCDWAVACSAHARDRLAALAPRGGEVALVHHGIDGRRFPPPPERPPPAPGAPVRVLCVCRAVEKKGLDVLLDALARLPDRVDWRLRHVGGGPLLARLRRRARRLGIDGRVEWLGPRPQEEVLRCYREADLFVLASRIARDGDRDGLPNVLMEAQSQRLACVATRVSAVPELIADGETGLLAPPDDAGALAAAVARLAADPALRRTLGRAGEARVRRAFSFDAGADQLAAKLGAAPASAPAAA